jgi:uncharacterized protein YbcI
MANTTAELGNQAVAISNAISRIHRDGYGRGPKTSRTVIQRNFVITFLEDIYTPLERTFIEGGATEDVKQTRQTFQMMMRSRFTAAVEEITGRKVIAFMSQNHFEPDMAAEIFVLEPTRAEAAWPDGASADDGEVRASARSDAGA